MKKIILIFSIWLLSTGCGVTDPYQDMEMLQKKYPKSIVYKLTAIRYIVLDSANALDIKVTLDGNIESTVKIK